MKTRNLKTIIAFAQSRGMMAVPVIEVLKAFSSMKCYSRPRIKTQRVKYPKCQLGYTQMEELLQKVLKRKEGIEKMLRTFGVETTIVIGGSLCLKYRLKQFWSREFHDIDLIIHPHSDDDKNKLRKAIEVLMGAGACKCSAAYYTLECNSFELGTPIMFILEEYPVNIIIGDIIAAPFPINQRFNTPFDVISAKKKYAEQAQAKHRPARPKDLIDIYKYINGK